MELKYSLDNYPEMQAAHKSIDVHNIVDLLIREVNPIFFRAVLDFLKSHDQWGTARYVHGLEGLRVNNQVIRPSDGEFIAPPNVDKLIQTIDTTYKQNAGKLRYIRGAIVELLATRLVQSRRSESECRSNHYFLYDDGTKSPEIDVAVLSESTRQIEGYSCKMNPKEFEYKHPEQLTGLAEHVQSSGYSTHIGMVSFGNTERQLKYLRCSSITAYGVDNITALLNDPFKPN